jgi:MFS transporter, VNT family, synaptic vesicle glycoprotein 2
MMDLLLPLFAVLTINQEWSFDINFLGIVYKPWRLFLLVCSLPNLFCVLILLFIVPESPKFTYATGDEEKTLHIFRKIHRINKGSSASFDISEISKNEEFGESCQKSSQGFFNFMWSQTTPLFKGSHLKNILTACFIQFASCNTINGFWTFLPEMMNKVSLWTQNSKDSATICEVFGSKFNASISSDLSNPQCIETLEFGAFLHAFESLAFFSVSYLIMTLVINRVGKLIILSVVMFSSGTAAILLIFVAIPEVSIYLYMIMVLAGLGISVVNASTVELFPTKMRSMAVCISMMFGRLGSVVGSLILGSIIDDYCSYSFIMPIVLLFTSFALGFTIPNISKRYK